MKNNLNAKPVLTELQRVLMTGVSYLIPFVVAGGILMGIGIGFGGVDVADATGTFFNAIYNCGHLAMSMMLPVLAGYIAFAIADKPGIAVGFIAGLLANAQGSGFLGALVGGLFAGYLVLYLKKIRVPALMKSIVPILIIPLIGGGITCIAMTYIIGIPCTAINTALTNFLNGLSGTNAILLGVIQGSMACSDLGGPINKSISAIILPAIEAGNWAPMAATFIPSMIPPFAMAAAMLIGKKKYTKEERANIPACLVGGVCMISETAIPFAAAHPLQTIPAFIVGGATGSALSYAFGLTMQSMHGGLFVLPLCNKPLMFLLALAIGTAVSTALLLLLRKAPAVEVTDEEE